MEGTLGPIQIVMVSYMRPNDLRTSIDTIIKYSDLPYHLTIIDNSVGHVDHVLDLYANHPSIRIIKNSFNIGKSRSFVLHLDDVLNDDQNDFFISIDGDIEVGKSWLSKLVNAKCLIGQPFGLLAPLYGNTINDQFVESGKLLIHEKKEFSRYSDGIFKNRKLGGGLILIDKQLYYSSGGYDPRFLYGGDDGKLCHAAAAQNRFSGIATNCVVKHLRSDETIPYQQWKKQSINNEAVLSGYWH